jgi:hypothetical protein
MKRLIILLILITVVVISGCVGQTTTLDNSKLSCITGEKPYLKASIIESSEYKLDNPDTKGISILLKIENIGNIPTSADGRIETEGCRFKDGNRSWSAMLLNKILGPNDTYTNYAYVFYYEYGNDKTISDCRNTAFPIEIYYTEKSLGTPKDFGGPCNISTALKLLKTTCYPDSNTCARV